MRKIANGDAIKETVSEEMPYGEKSIESDSDVAKAIDETVDVKVKSTTPAPTGKYRLLAGTRIDGEPVEAGTVLEDLSPANLAALQAQGAVEVIEKPVYVLAKNATPLSFLPVEGRYRALANLRFGDGATLVDAGSIVHLTEEAARSLAAQRVIEPVL